MSAGTEYNHDLCLQRHKELEKDIDLLFEKCRQIESKLWAIVLLLVANLAGVAVSLVK